MATAPLCDCGDCNVCAMLGTARPVDRPVLIPPTPVLVPPPPVKPKPSTTGGLFDFAVDEHHE
jgi:hypothetical protein